MKDNEKQIVIICAYLAFELFAFWMFYDAPFYSGVARDNAVMYSELGTIVFSLYMIISGCLYLAKKNGEFRMQQIALFKVFLAFLVGVGLLPLFVSAVLRGMN